jgi:STE24 endopeptidase
VALNEALNRRVEGDMFPITLLLALVIAFGIDSPGPRVPTSDVGYLVLETCGGISLVALLSIGLGLWVASQASNHGLPTPRLRRRYTVGTRLLTAVSLLVYGWIIHSVGWSRLVGTNWGLGKLGLFRDVVVFLPFIIIQLLVWSGQFFAERALQIRLSAPTSARLVRYLVSRSRQAFGLILPVVLLFVIRRDLITRLWPAWENDAFAEPIEIALLGSMVLIAAPLFIRLAWPTRPLPDGPLRRRLDRAARRAGFRFTDVLVWDTGGTVLNACVTGVLPGFRYVLFTDALVDSMTPVEVAAVFGHEIGHIAHHHLLYFGLFFAGSLGLLALLADGVSRGLAWVSNASWLASWIAPTGFDVFQEATVLCLLGAYFWLVFGYLSRRFERQADIYGSKLVSCPQSDCTPHVDLDADLRVESPVTSSLCLCRTGLRTFAEALAIVAQCNGINLDRRSWRHGSIAQRIRYLERLERNPALERRFQRDVVRLRLILGVVMILALVVAMVKQAIAN